ncbi:MAG: nucleotidyl transferase AbiEii/AbiGii toxin family protein [Gammaproteobacteria bacterium]
MSKKVIDMQASVRALLQNKAQVKRVTFEEIFQSYVMERFLYRLSKSHYSNRFILKGALLFIAWAVPDRRVTRDIDFLAYCDNQVMAIETAIRDICNVAVEMDGLVFDSKTVTGKNIKEEADYKGVRVSLFAFLGRARVSLQIDIGFGDAVYPRIKSIDYPSILNFPNPHLKIYPHESVISEKFEVMINLGSLNSRMKDFYDIWLMMHRFDFTSQRLSEALKKTFEKRKTTIPEGRLLFAEEIYDDQSDCQNLWQAFLKKGNIACAPPKLFIVAGEIEEFLKIPLGEINSGTGTNMCWTASGPWK